MHIDSDSALCPYPVIILGVFLTYKINLTMVIYFLTMVINNGNFSLLKLRSLELNKK